MVEEEVGHIETDNYKFTLAELDGILLCHIKIFNWSVRVYKDMLADFSAIREELGEGLLCCISKQDKKAKQIASLFGFYTRAETNDKVIMGL